MTRRAKILFAVALVASVGILIAVALPLFARDGASKVAQDLQSEIGLVFASGGEPERETQFLCSEIERGEAPVWGFVPMWVSGQFVDLPPVEEVRSAVDVLERAISSSNDSRMREWIEERAAVLEQFSRDGMLPERAAVSDAWRQIGQLNERFGDFCEIEENLDSYKGFTVKREGRYTGLKMWADFSAYGGEGTPECHIEIPASKSDRKGLELRVIVEREDGASEDYFQIAPASLIPTQAQRFTTGWFGLDDVEGDLFAVFDFAPEFLGNSPTKFTCQAKWEDQPDRYLEKSSVITTR